MSRVCTECGVVVGEKHRRSLDFIWKKKPRNLIQKKLEKDKEIKKMLSVN